MGVEVCVQIKIMRVGRGRGRESSAAADEAVTSEKPESQTDQSRGITQEPSLTPSAPPTAPHQKTDEERGRKRDRFSNQRPNLLKSSFATDKQHS